MTYLVHILVVRLGLFRELKSNLSKVSDWVKFRELGLGRNNSFISTIFEVRKLVKNSV